MSYRNSQIFVQSQTKRRLYLLTELYPQKTDNWQGTALIQAIEGSKASIDEVADRFINKVISEEYPLVNELEKKQDGLLKEYKAKQ